MASVSFSLARGTQDDLRPELITVGTSAPGSGDFELRIDVDTHKPTRLDIELAIRTFLQRIENQGFFKDLKSV